MSAFDAADALSLSVAEVREVARGVHLIDLRYAGGRELPPFTPGAHVELWADDGRRSRHWLCNAPAQADRYTILVPDDAGAPGASPPLVDQLREGSRVSCSHPGNTFALADRAPSLLFIVEGIGIAPVMSMLRHLAPAATRAAHVYYTTRDEASTAFADELRAGWPGRVVIHHDHGLDDNALDLWPILERPTGAHLYCCGSRALLESVRDMTGHWPASRIHFEATGGVEATRRADDRPFRVNLARSGASVDVAAGQSILDALRSAGHAVPSSCESGTCGTCRTRLLEGTADHRDLVLSDDERDDYIMVCVSRARSAELTLDR